MRREFELEEVTEDGESFTTVFERLDTAQEDEWRSGTAYRVIAELAVPDRPLTEPLVLNVWYQSQSDAEWRLLD